MPDSDRMATALITLLKGKTEPFRFNLLTLAKASGVSNTARRKLFDHFADTLSFTEVCEAVGGIWLLSEVEGPEVQFNPIVREPRLPAKLDMACWDEYSASISSLEEDDEDDEESEDENPKMRMKTVKKTID